MCVDHMFVLMRPLIQVKCTVIKSTGTTTPKGIFNPPNVPSFIPFQLSKLHSVWMSPRIKMTQEGADERGLLTAE